MKLPALLIALAMAAASVAAEDVKVVAKANYAAVDKAFMARDIKAADAAMRPRVTGDFKAIAGGRQVSYQGLLANFRSMFTAFTTITSSTSKIVDCKVNGKTATLRVLGRLSAKVKGPDGKAHAIDLSNTSEDIWKEIGGKWKCAKSTTLKQSTSLDGKVLPGHQPVNF